MKDAYSIVTTKDGFYDLYENIFNSEGALIEQTLVKRYKTKTGAKNTLKRYENEKRWKEGKVLVESLILSELKLLPNAKPGLFHNHTVRSNVKSYLWSKKVRPAVLELKGKSCSICGWSPKNEQELKKLHLHEIEVYDFHNMVCHLKDIEIICVKCHAFHHIARTKSVVTKEQWNDLLNHFIKVNGCTPKIVKYWAQFEMRVFELENDKNKEQNIDLPFGEFLNRTVRYTISSHIPFANEMMNRLEKLGLLYHTEP